MLLPRRIENGSPGLVRTLGQEIRQTAHLQLSANRRGCEVVERPIVCKEFVMGFRVTREVQNGFSTCGGAKRDLLGQDRLTAAGRSNDHHDGASKQAAAQHEVEVRYTRLEPL